MSDITMLIRPGEFPHAGNTADKILFWLNYAVLAPSAHNTQPWYFSIDRDTLSVYRDDNYVLNAGDPTLRQAYLGIGACIENFQIAAEHWGYKSEFQFLAYKTSENPVAVIKVKRSSVPDNMLFQWLTKRHTNRGAYRQKQITDVNLISQEKPLGCARLTVITDSKTKHAIADLVGQSMGIGLTMNALKEELSHFVHSRAKPKDTGMTIESMIKTSDRKYGDRVNPKGEIKNMSGFRQGETSRKNFLNAPVICCISSELEGPTGWMDSGRLLQRVLLRATSIGLSHDICAAPIEIPTAWPRLRLLLSIKNRPQVLFRIGYPIDHDMSIASTRRPPKII